MNEEENLATLLEENYCCIVFILYHVMIGILKFQHIV